jgi:hypothetical protein
MNTSVFGLADGNWTGLSSAQAMVSPAAPNANPSDPAAPEWKGLDRLMVAHTQRSQLSDVAIDELAGASVMRLVYRPEGVATLGLLTPDTLDCDAISGDLQPRLSRAVLRPDWAAMPVVLGLAAGLWAERTAIVEVRKRRLGRAGFRTASHP